MGFVHYDYDNGKRSADLEQPLSLAKMLGGMCMWLRIFSWRTITGRCLQGALIVFSGEIYAIMSATRAFWHPL
jgi:hypothetical protein